jgi:hypothetical protein
MPSDAKAHMVPYIVNKFQYIVLRGTWVTERTPNRGCTNRVKLNAPND